MPKITPLLRTDKKNEKGLCPIVIVYQIERKRFRAPTGRGTDPLLWNPKTKTQEWVKDAPELNMILRQLINDIIKLQDTFRLQKGRYPQVEEMRDMFNIHTGKKAATDLSVFSLFDDFIHYQSAERGVNNVTYGVYKNYKKVKQRLRLYQEHVGEVLTFERLDIGFGDKFINFMTNQHNSGANTIGSYITILKTFFKYCINHRGVKIAPIVLANMKSRYEDNWFTYLTIDELTSLANKDFHMAPLWDKTRDAFCLQCYLGCRFSDLLILRKENIVVEGGRTSLKMKTKKNEKRINVPLHPIAKKILEKYTSDPKEWMPKIGVCNRYIKEVCREAEINIPEEVTKGGGDKRKSLIFKKYQLITTHTARRTFINLMRKSGIDDTVICAMTGQSLKTMQRYKNADQSDLIEAMEKGFETKITNLKIA